MEKDQPIEYKIENGVEISSSKVLRLENEVMNLKEEYDSLKIKSLTM